MDFGISGKVAMVAAGTKGIGLAAAVELAQEGCRVSVCGRNEAAFPDALAAIGPSGIATVCDVAQRTQLADWHAATVERFGPIDILVTNTGGPPAGTWQDMDEPDWQTGIDSTLMNVVRLVKAVAPGMADRGWGRIVHVTSLVAKEPNQILAISSTLRSGLMALTRLQSDSLAPSGVTVNAVLPGHTLTDRQRHLAEIVAEREGISVESALQQRGRSIPVGRMGEPGEIAAAIAFLCSGRASFVTGVNLLVDGGLVRGFG